jgi:formylmethanofuran dehydrogenase subunit E
MKPSSSCLQYFDRESKNFVTPEVQTVLINGRQNQTSHQNWQFIAKFHSHKTSRVPIRTSMNMLSSKLYTFVSLTVIALLLDLTLTNAFQIIGPTKTASVTSLNAWTLPKPDSKNMFSKFTSSSFSTTWYDDHNPTARKIVYNEYVSPENIFDLNEISSNRPYHCLSSPSFICSDQEEPFRFVTSFSTDDWIITSASKTPVKEVKMRRPLRVFASNVYKLIRHVDI